jgi:lipopolysaccharide export system permease protein
MDRIDRYIIRQFLMTFVFGVMAFVVIFVAVNLLENLDEFSDHNVPTLVIARYYLYYTPEIIHLVVPIAILLASLFTIGRLDQTSELTAIRAAGRSMRRVALPLLVIGFIVSGAMVYFNGWLVPQANKLQFGIDRKYLGRNLTGGQSNVYLRISATVNLRMEYFDPNGGQANQVSIERFDTAAPVVVTTVPKRNQPVSTAGDTVRTIRITERIDAMSMKYDSTRKIWIMLDGIARNFHDPSRIATTRFQKREIAFLPVTPHELELSQQNVKEMGLDELRARIEQERLSGRDVTPLLVDYYSLFSFPFSAFIVVFFGIPFSATQRKGGAAVPIAITALISAIYLVFTEVSKTFSYGSNFPPELTAWLANILFLIVGIINLIRVERG